VGPRLAPLPPLRRPWKRPAAPRSLGLFSSVSSSLWLTEVLTEVLCDFANKELVHFIKRTRTIVIDDIVGIVQFENGGVAALDLNFLSCAELFRECGQDGIVLGLVLVAEGDFLVDADHVIRILAQGAHELFPWLFQIFAEMAPRRIQFSTDNFFGGTSFATDGPCHFYKAEIFL
jgi:hypothetical protein